MSPAVLAELLHLLNERPAVAFQLRRELIVFVARDEGLRLMGVA